MQSIYNRCFSIPNYRMLLLILLLLFPGANNVWVENRDSKTISTGFQSVVYDNPVQSSSRNIMGVSTSITAFVGTLKQGPFNQAFQVTNWNEFETVFGGLDENSETSYAVYQYFINQGDTAFIVRIANDESGNPESVISNYLTGLKSLSEVELINILCIPQMRKMNFKDAQELLIGVLDYCKKQKVFFLIDLTEDIQTVSQAVDWLQNMQINDANAALYFPALSIADPLNFNQPRTVGPSGTIAGLYARTDREQGVWKSPAGVDADLLGVTKLEYNLNDSESSVLNTYAINSIRNFPSAGIVSWGARTLAGTDGSSSDWKYIPVRRFGLFLEESISLGLEWAQFEPNDATLWLQITAVVQDFMLNVYRQGAFSGQKPDEAFWIRCDGLTTTESDIKEGIVHVMVGFAPLRPAEFILLTLNIPAGETNQSKIDRWMDYSF